MLYNSDTLWVVQFYNHWCGHCQRFAPTWKDLAKDNSAWSPLVKFAAINCAEQSCDRYQIQGTPTVRLFHPRTSPNRLDSAFYGFNLPVNNDKEYFLDNILYNIEVAESRGVQIPVNLKMIRNVPESSKNRLSKFFETVPDSVEKAALIFEREGKGSVGKRVILDMNKHSGALPIFRANVYDAATRSWRFTTSPSMVIVDSDGNVLERVDGHGFTDREQLTSILTKYVKETLENARIPKTEVTTTSQVLYTVPDKVVQITKDEVFMGDLEKAVEYSIMKEIAMQPVLDTEKLQTMVYYLDAVLNYFPNMKTPLRKFLISLREWPVQMRFATVSNVDYKKKVHELSNFYLPFDDTPAEWEGCAGSQSHFRGYPCSLWTLFHTLVVNSMDEDPAFQHGGVSTVANAMIGYISKFFSCRECADHFSRHVSKLGYLPHTGDQSILWLWTLHNMANLMLAGDQTEDPTRPKIQWPSPQNCPACRDNGNRWKRAVKINGELWNKEEVLNYIKAAYKEENLKPNTKNTEPKNEIEEILRNLKKDLNSDDTLLFEEAHDKIISYCMK